MGGETWSCGKKLMSLDGSCLEHLPQAMHLTFNS